MKKISVPYMQALIIPETRETPEIILDKEKGLFSFSGISFSENPNAFYKPVIEWISTYMDQPNKNTEVHFKFVYFNTSSLKQIAKLLFILECIANNTDVTINWYYHDKDQIMYNEGADFAEIFKLKFNLVIY